jgi:hypothetical protein
MTKQTTAADPIIPNEHPSTADLKVNEDIRLGGPGEKTSVLRVSVIMSVQESQGSTNVCASDSYTMTGWSVRSVIGSIVR